MNWINAGNGFGFHFTPTTLKWIWWKPGTKTQEGELSWGEETLGVIHHGDTQETLISLLNAGIIEKLGKEIERRNKRPIQSPEIPHKQNAYLLGQFISVLLAPNEKTIIGFFRHNCCSYDQKVRKGEDRLVASLNAHNMLLEILEFFKENKEHFQEKHIEQPTSQTEWQNALASLDHDAIISAIFAENKRREESEISV